MHTRWSAVLAAAALALAVSACNTARGAGEDIESVGQEIDKQL